MFAMGSARRSLGAGVARVWAPLEAEPGPREDGEPGPLEDGPGPSGTFQNGRWDGTRSRQAARQTAMAALPVTSWGSDTQRHGNTTPNTGPMAIQSGQQDCLCPEIGRKYMESCAILVAQRISPAADVWARGRKARAPATGVDGTGAAGPRSLTDALSLFSRRYINVLK